MTSLPKLPFSRLTNVLILTAVFGIALMTLGSVTTVLPPECSTQPLHTLPLHHCRPSGFPGVSAMLLGFPFAAIGVVGLAVSALWRLGDAMTKPDR